MLYEVYLDNQHVFNIVCAEGQLPDMLKKMAFLGQSVIIRNRFYGSSYIWSGAQELLVMRQPVYA